MFDKVPFLILPWAVLGCYRSSAVLEQFSSGDTDSQTDTDTFFDETDSINDTEPPYESIFPLEWETPVYIKAFSSTLYYHFGQSLAISGNSLLVGADGESRLHPDLVVSPGVFLSNVGAAYVFSRTEDGQWHEEGYIKASNSEDGDFFGWSVAMEGDVLVVGAPDEDSAAVGINGDDQNNDAPSAGAVYIYTKTNGEWMQQAYVKASNAQTGDRFGWSVDISKKKIVVSAIGEAGASGGINGSQWDDSAIEAGAVYVFEQSGDQWMETAYIKSDHPDAHDFFGYAVSLNDDQLAVSAHGEQNNEGAAYIFEHQNGGWHQTASLTAANAGTDDRFGSALDLFENTLVVGAQQEDSSAEGVNGNELDDSATFSGAAYVFEKVNGMWAQTAYLKASNTNSFDLFGCSVAVYDHLVAVGAYGESSAAADVNGLENDNSSESSGAVYLFEKLDGQWRQQAYIKAFNNDMEDYFGTSVALGRSLLAVGATGEDTPASGITVDPPDRQDDHSSGAVYVYSLDSP